MPCRICKNPHLKEFLSLGINPLANNFLRKEDFTKPEPKFPLMLCFCDTCKLVQLSHVVDPEQMFKNYVYVTSTTKTFQVHFGKMADHLTERFKLGSQSLVVDIGSNDGLLLKGFQNHGVKVFGVEPATNLAKMAQEAGVDTLNEFFGPAAVAEIIKRKGHADILTANNVFAHIGNIHAVAENAKAVLKPTGVFVIEIQYFGDTMKDMTFDNVYHEHLSYFTLTALQHFFHGVGMQIFDVQHVDSHGGSLRVFIQKAGSPHPVTEAVAHTLEKEQHFGVNDFSTYQRFAQQVYETKQKLVETVLALKRDGKRLAGYGAPAKASTLLNFCELTAHHLDYIVEDNPLKQGLYQPGTHIPIVDSNHLAAHLPDYLLILAWNFAPEILAKVKPLTDKGMKCIVPLPELKVV